MQQAAIHNSVLIPPGLDPAGLARPVDGGRPVVLRGQTMGTDWSCTYCPPSTVSPRSVKAALQAVFAEVIADFSNWDRGSFISRFNMAADGSSHIMPKAFETVLAQALDVAAASNGAFNPCLGAMTESLAFDGSGGTPIAAAPLAGWTDVMRQGDRLLKGADVRLDLSAIAKGYAVDRMGHALEAIGVSSFLVEIGGEFLGRGVKPDGLPWWVRLNGQADTSYVAALHNLAVATSGRGARVYHTSGGAMEHIVSRGVTDLAAVSVLHSSCMVADAWATALYASGLAAGRRLAEEHDLAALLVPRRGLPVHSVGLEAMLK